MSTEPEQRSVHVSMYRSDGIVHVTYTVDGEPVEKYEFDATDEPIDALLEVVRSRADRRTL